jgi:hypothetical protein
MGKDKPKKKDHHELLDEALKTFDHVVIVGYNDGEQPVKIPVEEKDGKG